MNTKRRMIWTMGLCGALCMSMAGPAWADEAEAKIAQFHLNGPLIEKPQGDFGFSFGFEPVTLMEMVDRFEQAREDDEVRAILITFGTPGMGFAQLEEIRQAMQNVGKPVYVHADALNTGLYALATAGTHISVTPTGDVWLLGFYAEAPYLKGLLEKINVVPDFVHIGDFKSAGETLYRDGPSEPAEENVNWLLDGLFDSILDIIADARFHGDVSKARAIIDGGPYTADKALELGLIDSVQHVQDLVAGLKAKYGDDLVFVKNYGADSGPDLDFSNPFALFGLIGELMSGGKESTEPAIAVVYVEGMIVPGSEDPNPFGGGGGARSTTIRRALDKAADDDSVKAVVLRVDSPGGSALASEIIYNATLRVRETGKPLVVSMGNVAGSGGYYVACGADYIIADPTTITASIGVVGGKLVTTSMWNSIGVTWHAYKRGESADLMTSARKWDDTQRTRILDWMTEIYGIFKGHIVEHRGDKLAKPIEQMAGGRVYTGAQALELGLVDDLGSFSDAIDKAADLASIADYEIRVLPKPRTIFDLFREGVGDQESDSVSVRAVGQSLFGTGSPIMQAVLPMLHSLDPQRTTAIMTALKRLELIHNECVVLMMPTDIVIRYR